MAEPIDEYLLAGRLGIRETLGKVERDALNALPVTLRAFDSGDYLLREGDRPKHCSYLQRGFVYRHKIVGDGERQIVSVHVPGDFVDAQNIMFGEADHNIQALTDTVMCMVPIDQLLTVALAHPAITRALWHETLIEAAIMRERIANIGRRDARARTAHMLCEMAVRSEAAGLGPRETFDLPMTQEQLGDMLGLTSVHVNRMFKTLENEGLITRNKRSVTVQDWHALRSVGDFTANYLHLAGTAPASWPD